MTGKTVMGIGDGAGAHDGVQCRALRKAATASRTSAARDWRKSNGHWLGRRQFTQQTAPGQLNQHEIE